MSDLIIAATNRPGSFTHRVAHHCQRLWQEVTGRNLPLYSLTDLNGKLPVGPEVYDAGLMPGVIRSVRDEVLVPAVRWHMVVPEYNGSFPGILKYWIDALSIDRAQETFRGKKVLLTGVSDGRAGNLRGMDQLTGLLNHLGVIVYPDKLPMSGIETLMSEDLEEIADQGVLRTLRKQIQAFDRF